VLDNGVKVCIPYRQERFVLKIKKLAVTILKSTQVACQSQTLSLTPNLMHPTSSHPKCLQLPSRFIEIAREHGMAFEEIFTHDHCPTNQPPPLFDGDFTSATTE